MYTKTIGRRARLLVWAGALSCVLVGKAVIASEQLITVAIHVNARGLDLEQPADARTLYRRIEHAAQVVCTEGYRIDLVRIYDYKTCYRNAVAGAIRSVRKPLLTRVYLETHTLEEAATAGIDLPGLAAK